MSKKKFTDTSLSRRRFLGTSGAGVAAAMLGGGVLPAGFGRAVMAQDGAREFHSAWPYVDPGAGGHFNTFVTNGIMNPPNIYGDIMWVPGALLYWADNTYMPLVAESWQFITTGFADAAATPAATPAASPVTGDADVAAPELNADGRLPSAADNASPDADTLRVNLRQGVMWSNGEELTAQDFLDTFSIYRLQSNTMWDYIADIEALDDYTLNVYMDRRSTVVERYVIRASLRPSSVYGEIASRAREVFDSGATNTDDAWVQLVQEFNEFRPTEQVVNGPFMIDPDSITNAQLTMVKNDTSYWAENVNFDRIINYNGETDTISAVVLSGDVDYATHGFAPATERSMMEQGIRVLRAPTYSGPALKFNFRALPALADKRVRQAIAHVIDRNENGFVSLAESGVGVEYMSGISDNFTDTWLSEDVVSQLNRYEHDLDGAAALLEEAGWTRDGDRWMDADGNPAEYELIFPSEFADWSAAGTNVAEQLTAFGIQVSPRPITFTQIGTDVQEGRFQMAIQGWGNSANPHPHYSYFQAFFFQNTRTDAPSDRGMDFPLVQETEVMGEVDIDDLVVATGEGMNADEQRELVGQAALVFNELLNIIPLFERYGNNAVLEGVRVQPWPDDDAPIMQNSFYADGIVTILMLDGTLQPVE